MSGKLVFGVDRDPLARVSWYHPPPPFEDDGEPCEVHGDNRAACERFEIEAQAETDREIREAGLPPDPGLITLDHRL